MESHRRSFESPRELRYLLTGACNFRCTFCHNEGQPHGVHNGQISAADYAFLFSECTALGVKTCTLSGGEPLLRHDFDEIVNCLIAVGAHVTVITNGSLVPQHLSALSKVSEIHISLHVANREHYERIVGGTLDYDAAVNNVGTVCGLGPRVKLNIVALSEYFDGHALREVVALSQRYGVSTTIIEEMAAPRAPRPLVAPLLAAEGFQAIQRGSRKTAYRRGEHIIELMQIFCDRAYLAPHPATYCHDHNDLYLSPTAQLFLCRLSSNALDLLPAIKTRDGVEVRRLVEEGFMHLGLNCPLLSAKLETPRRLL